MIDDDTAVVAVDDTGKGHAVFAGPCDRLLDRQFAGGERQTVAGVSAESNERVSFLIADKVLEALK